MPVVFTGTLKSGSASVTGISSTAALVAGQVVTGTGIPSGTTIQSIQTINGTTLDHALGERDSQRCPEPQRQRIDSTPANVIPFQGDFDGDGLTDLAYYEPSNATWYMYDSKTPRPPRRSAGHAELEHPRCGQLRH